MNKGLRIGLQLVLLLVGLLVVFLGWKSVKEPVDFEEKRDSKYAEVIHKMREIRDAQIAYRDYHKQYASTWDQLISFIDTGKYVVLETKDVKVMKKQRGLSYEGTETVIDTLDVVPLKDSLFKKYKNASKAEINELRYIPGLSEKKDFEIESTLDEKFDSLNNKTIKTIRFEVRAPKRDLLNSLDGNFDNFYVDREIHAEKGIKDTVLKIGSLGINSTDGNWPKSYDLLVDDTYGK